MERQFEHNQAIPSSDIQTTIIVKPSQASLIPRTQKRNRALQVTGEKKDVLYTNSEMMESVRRQQDEIGQRLMQSQMQSKAENFMSNISTA